MSYNNRGYNNYDRRGGYDRGYDRRDSGYDRGYDRRDNYRNNNYNDAGPSTGFNPNPQAFPFDIGQKVRVKFTGAEVSIIRFGREQIECRCPDHSSQWFYIYELEAIEGDSNT